MTGNENQKRKKEKLWRGPKELSTSQLKVNFIEKVIFLVVFQTEKHHKTDLSG